MNQWVFWLILVIFLAFIEIITINLVTIWFVISGIISFIISIFFDNFTAQFAVFVIGGIILLITTKPILTKYFSVNKIKTNIDRIVGMKGIVIEKINKNQNGLVKIDGKVWTAYAEHPIEKDEIVKILEIKGARIKVEKEND